MALRPKISSVLALVVFSSVAATGEKSTFPIALTKPAGDGPFPAVVTLATIVDKPEIGKRTDARLVAAVALDPGCGQTFGTWSVARSRALGRPIAGYCLQADCTLADPDRGTRRLDAGRAQPQLAAGYPVEIKVYPGAHHSFDSILPVRHVADRINAHSATGRGATTGANRALGRRDPGGGAHPCPARQVRSRTTGVLLRAPRLKLPRVAQCPEFTSRLP